MTTKANRSRGMPRRSTAPSTGRSRAPLLIGAGVIVLIVIAAIAAIVLSGGSSSGLAEPANAAIGVSGDPLPALSDPASDPAVGLAIPTITGTDLAAEPMTIGPADGPAAIVLLAHWCSHCQVEVPVLVDFLATTGMPDGVELVAISTSINRAQPNYPPSAWLEREGWTPPTMVDDSSSRALAALGMSSFPGFVFVDAEGRVVQRITGEISADAFAQIVESLAP